MTDTTTLCSMKDKNKKMRSTFKVKGMHCAACEVLIEKKLIGEKTVAMVDAKTSRRTVTVEHVAGDRIAPLYLNKLFKEDGYTFERSAEGANDKSLNWWQLLLLFLAMGVILAGLNKTGLTTLVSVDSKTALPVFILFGLLAGFSTCAALVGGIVLALSRQWLIDFADNDGTLKKLEPHFLFNTGRLLGFAMGGGFLGYLGTFFNLSPIFGSILSMAIAGLMVILGLQMLGVKALDSFQLRLPKFITGKVADETNFNSRLGPVLMGGLTFLLPCGFTMTAQAAALASGSVVGGSLIMACFALGTMPGLLLIGFSSVKLYSNRLLAQRFSKIAGVLVLMLALYTINNQLVVLGWPILPSNNNNASAKTAIEANQKQIIKMTATGRGYSPNQFTIKAGVPTEWQIESIGNAGCVSTIVARGLFPERIDLATNATITKEFIADKSGVYQFSCGMGMYRGTITVTD